MRSCSIFYSSVLALASIVSTLTISQNTVYDNPVDLSNEGLTIDQGSFLTLIDNEITTIGGDFDNNGGFYITSKNSITFTITNNVFNNHGNLSFDALSADFAPTFDIISVESFSNTGNMWFYSAGAAATPFTITSTGSWDNEFLIYFKQATGSASPVNIVGVAYSASSINNNGIICLDNTYYYLDSYLTGSGCLAAMNSGSVQLNVNNGFGFSPQQLIYLADSTSNLAILGRRSGAAPQFTVAGFGGGNKIIINIGFTMTGSYGPAYSSVLGLVTVYGTGCRFSINIGYGYSPDLFHFTSNVGSPGKISYNGSVPSNEVNNRAATKCVCNTFPTIPTTVSISVVPSGSQPSFTSNSIITSESSKPSESATSSAPSVPTILVNCKVNDVTIAIVDLTTGTCPFRIPVGLTTKFDYTSSVDYSTEFYYAEIDGIKYFTDIANMGLTIDIPAKVVYGTSGVNIFQVIRSYYVARMKRDSVSEIQQVVSALKTQTGYQVSCVALTVDLYVDSDSTEIATATYSSDCALASSSSSSSRSSSDIAPNTESSSALAPTFSGSFSATKSELSSVTLSSAPVASLGSIGISRSISTLPTSSMTFSAVNSGLFSTTKSELPSVTFSSSVVVSGLDSSSMSKASSIIPDSSLSFATSSSLSFATSLSTVFISRTSKSGKLVSTTESEKFTESTKSIVPPSSLSLSFFLTYNSPSSVKDSVSTSLSSRAVRSIATSVLKSASTYEFSESTKTRTDSTFSSGASSIPPTLVNCMVNNVTIAIVDLATGICPFRIPDGLAAKFDYTSSTDYFAEFYYAEINSTKYYTDIVNKGLVINILAKSIFGTDGVGMQQVKVESFPGKMKRATTEETNQFVTYLKTIVGEELPCNVIFSAGIFNSGHSTVVATATYECNATISSSSTTRSSRNVSSSDSSIERVTQTNTYTKFVTTTSCSDNRCSEVIVPNTPTLTTEIINGDATVYTTYCPVITSCSDNKCSEDIIPAPPHPTNSITSIYTYYSPVEPQATKSIIFTSCSEHLCSLVTAPVTPVVTTKTKNGETIVFTNYYPISEHSSFVKTLDVISVTENGSTYVKTITSNANVQLTNNIMETNVATMNAASTNTVNSITFFASLSQSGVSTSSGTTFASINIVGSGTSSLKLVHNYVFFSLVLVLVPILG